MSPQRARHGHVVHAAPAAQLASLDFLVGRLAGEGTLGQPAHRFTKRVTGSWRAAGHHLVLQMAADYELPDGAIDSHSAVLVVSAGARQGSLVARAFTDGGGMLEYEPILADGGVTFADAVPHARRARRARKRLRPTAKGYEEVLDVDRGDGAWEPWARIELQRER